MPPPHRRRSRHASRPTAGDAAQAPPADASRQRYTLDALAAATGVPSRTIRFYHAKHLLPPPQREGRVAIYDEAHVARLRLIGTLQDRGLSLRAVHHVLRDDSDDARLLSARLGLADSLERPWSDDRSRIVRHAELLELIGDRAPGTVALLVRYGVVRREGAGDSYRVPSPALLRVTLALQDGGVDVDTAARGGAILGRRLGQAADELVRLFSKRAGRGFGRTRAPADLVATLDALRPLARDAAQVIFARQIERALRGRRGAPAGRSARRRGAAVRRRIAS